MGTGFGLLGGFAFGRLLSGVLFQISSTDPPTYIAVSALLLFVTFLGCYVPAVRATRVDPMVVLRHE
ncbi:MAG: hypothetical protein DMG13_07760 [Acidobacteria bacterium]|nr:MAG: hypothetical protein DMG13_07760 [Acidobacteriota bacterium]